MEYKRSIVEYEWSTAEYSGVQRNTVEYSGVQRITAEYEWSTSGVQAEYKRSTGGVQWSTVEYSGVQAECVKYGGVPESRLFPLVPTSKGNSFC